MSNTEIEEICLKYNISDYTINSDGTIDVDGDVNFYDYGLTKIQLNFNKVTGYFHLGGNELTSLKGSPKEVGGNFSCSYNDLTSLEGGPEKVNGNYYVYNNKLNNLNGSPKEVGGNFDCSNNKLTDLKGSPKGVGGNFYCNNNKITSLEFGPEVIKNGTYSVQNNDLYDTYGLKTKGYHYIYLNNNPVSNVFINKHGFNEFDPKSVIYFNSAKIIEKKNNEYSVNIKRLQYIQTMFEIKIDTIKISKYYDINY